MRANYTVTLSDDRKTIEVVNTRTGNNIETLITWESYLGKYSSESAEAQAARLNESWNK